MDFEQLVEQAVAEEMRVAPSALSRRREFSEQGVDSLAGLRICRGLGERLGFAVEPEWMFDHPTIEQLAACLRARAAQAGASHPIRAAAR